MTAEEKNSFALFRGIARGAKKCSPTVLVFFLRWVSLVLERGVPARHEANDEYIVAPSSGRQFVCRYRAMQTEFV